MEYKPRCIYLENAWSLAKYVFFEDGKQEMIHLTMIGEIHGMESYVYGKRKTMSISDFCVSSVEKDEALGLIVKILIEIENSFPTDGSEKTNIESIPIIEILNKIHRDKIIGYNDRVQYIDEPHLYYTDNTNDLYAKYVRPFHEQKNNLLSFEPEKYYSGSIKYLELLKRKIINFFNSITNESSLDDIRKAWAMVTDFNVLRIIFEIRESPTHFIMVGGFAHPENIHQILTEGSSNANSAERTVENLISGTSKKEQHPMFYPDIDILQINSARHSFRFQM